MSSRCSAAPAGRRWTRSRSVAPSPPRNKRILAGPSGTSYLVRVTEPEISLTTSAAKRVASIAARQHKPAILRLAVDGGGCAGFTYKFELAPEADNEDEIAETDGVKLIVDPISLDLVRGSAVD